MTFSSIAKRAVFSLLAALTLTACTSTATKNANDVLDYDANTDYRKTEDKLADKLDMPPNLFAMSKQQDAFDKALKDSAKADADQNIPTYKANNVHVESNLSERWLAIKGMDSQQVWSGVQSFLKTLGYEIKDARKDTGFIRTKFTERKELVPLDAQGPLTRVLNSWRPTLADGIYDRLIARVVYRPETQQTDVYFYHTMIYDATQADSDDLNTPDKSGWKIKHYNPLIEAEALYQAMIFFGTSQQDALKQIEITTKQTELVGDKTEFEGLVFKAPKTVSWNYLIAMIYRSGWHVDHMKQNSYEVWVKVPEQVRDEKSLASTLAFWKKDEKQVPAVVRFSFEDYQQDKKQYSLLKVHSLEGATPLNAAKREYLFKALGLLAE
ncbi:MAG: outer membrane protein assembly factor BamC [Hydrogenovibrio sp.]|nr:outer membrane protein assembly factor BamC [Hydrogenovibrio sp.]